MIEGKPIVKIVQVWRFKHATTTTKGSTISGSFES